MLKKYIAVAGLGILGFSALSNNVLVHAAEMGSGNADVTYNVDKVNPDDNTTNPDFSVLIPIEYQLSDKAQLSKGVVSVRDGEDITKNYDGEAQVTVTIGSSNATKFEFENGGKYNLVDDTKNELTKDDTDSQKYKLTLDKTTTETAVNAHLTKKGTKKAGTDKLIFEYVGEISQP